MKFTARAADLAERISTAAQIVSPNARLLTQTGVQIGVSKRTVTIQGSDPDTTIVTRLPLEDDVEAKSGTILVAPKALLAYLTRLPDSATVTVTAATPTRLDVQAGDAPAYQFVALTGTLPAPASSRNEAVPVDLTNLAAAVALVEDCAAPATPGSGEKVVQLVSGTEGLRLHATDRYRLARAELGTGAAFGEFDGLLPLRVVETIAAAAPTHVTVEPKRRTLIFSNDTVTISTVVSSDPYPTVDSVLGGFPPNSAKIRRRKARAALRRLKSIAVPGSSMRVSIAAGEMTCEVSNASAGVGVETIPVEDDGGAEVEFSINTDYLSAACDAGDSAALTLAWSAPQAPVFITDTDPVPLTLVIAPMSDP